MSSPCAPKLSVPTLSHLRLVRYAEGWGHTPADYARALNGTEQTPLKTTAHPVTGKPFVSVYRARLVIAGSTKRGGEPSTAEVVVKVNPLPTLGKQIQAMLKRTKHHRQWRGAELAEGAGVRAASPLVILRARTDWGEAEVLILEHAEGRTLLERFADHQNGLAMPQLIAPALGEVIVNLERGGVWNRDPKPSNLVVSASAGGDIGITLLDTVGVERRAARHPALLRHVVKLLLLETSGTQIPTPPRFTIDLVTSALQLSAKRGANTQEIERRADKLIGEVRKSIAEQDSTPTDSPVSPPS